MSKEGADEGWVWRVEGEAINAGLTQEVFELADCVELPAKLGMHDQAAELDPDHADAFDEWFAYLMEPELSLLLPVEQSCDDVGMLLPWDMRAVRLWTLPSDLLEYLHQFFEECPRHTRALVVHYVFWLVRFERVRRLGKPEWTMADVVIPELEEPAFYRPNKLTIRRPLR